MKLLPASKKNTYGTWKLTNNVSSDSKTFHRFFHATFPSKGRFEAWAYPVKASSYRNEIEAYKFDHTYVVHVDNGVRWRCHGGNTGGRLLAAGKGDYNGALCVARSASEEAEAGIAYGKTGVCHQIANRILYPAGFTVVNARGSSVSSSLYGTYGDSETWSSKLKTCFRLAAWKRQSLVNFALISAPDINLSDSTLMLEQSPDAEPVTKLTPEESYFVKLASLYALKEPLSLFTLLGADLEITLRYLLSEKISAIETKEIIQHQQTMIKEHQDVKSFLIQNDQAAINHMAKILETTFEKFEKILGASRYTEAFSIAPQWVNEVIMPPNLRENNPHFRPARGY